jgi:hypothetical protein
LIEPIMMAFLGVVVGGLIVAMYLPVFELAGNVEDQVARAAPRTSPAPAVASVAAAGLARRLTWLMLVPRW